MNIDNLKREDSIVRNEIILDFARRIYANTPAKYDPILRNHISMNVARWNIEKDDERWILYAKKTGRPGDTVLRGYEGVVMILGRDKLAHRIDGNVQ